MHWQTIVVCQCTRWDNYLLELLGELGQDTLSKHIRHVQYLLVHFIISHDIASPIRVQTGHRLFQCQIEMRSHHCLHLLR